MVHAHICQVFSGVRVASCRTWGGNQGQEHPLGGVCVSGALSPLCVPLVRAHTARVPEPSSADRAELIRPTSLLSEQLRSSFPHSAHVHFPRLLQLPNREENNRGVRLNSSQGSP